MSLMQVDLEDKYRLDTGRIYLSGIQALVRLPMMQRQRDRAPVSTPAASSPAIAARRSACTTTRCGGPSRTCRANDIDFQPGLNEDLAATAVWGSQQVGLFPGAKVDGVFGIWYGKGPGVDRSMDALKHANSAGTSRHGGVLALAGDDHGCQSSTLAHQSEQVFAAAMIPVLNPATLQDYLDLGIHGFALSRYSGCWVGFKAISETVESSASVCGDPDADRDRDAGRFRSCRRAGSASAGPTRRWTQRSAGCMGRRWRPCRLRPRQPLDRIVLDSRPARLGIVTTGKAYLDVRQALDDLGIPTRSAPAARLRIYKVG